MKLGKEEIQKLALSLILLAALLYCYVTFLLGPLKGREAAATTEIAELQPKIKAAKSQLKETAALEAKAPKASDTYAQILSMAPEGAPVAWFPPRIVEFFHRQGIERASVRLVREADSYAEVPNFRRLTWAIDLPAVKFIPLGIALAGLENEEPLLQINALQIEGSGVDVEAQHTILSVTTLVRK